MKAIILAAGRGSRMAGLTDEKPKCLTVLGGRSLIQWQLAALREAGITRVGVVSGYRAALLRGYGEQGFHNSRWDRTNMVMSLAAADQWLREGTCVVSYSDIVYHPDIVRALMSVEGSLVITYDALWAELWKMRFDAPLSDAESFQVDAEVRLTAIGERVRSIDEIGGQYMGLLSITPDGWNQILRVLEALSPQEQDALDVTALLRALREHGAVVAAVRVEGRWAEVDSASDVAKYASRLEGGEEWNHDWRF